ncbi:MAG: hypothetical protein AAFW69_05210 [Pseudomonadota bacterium]
MPEVERHTMPEGYLRAQLAVLLARRSRAGPSARSPPTCPSARPSSGRVASRGGCRRPRPN